MSRQADAVIIGAGVIGAAIAFELAKRGYETLNIDKLPASGYGPTSNSCAIVRAHYSSREGVAMAYEGFSYWQDWERLPRCRPTTPVRPGTCSRARSCSRAAPVTTRRCSATTATSGIEYEEWDNAELRRRMPIYDTERVLAAEASRATRTSGISRTPSSTAPSSRPARAT